MVVNVSLCQNCKNEAKLTPRDACDRCGRKETAGYFYYIRDVAAIRSAILRQRGLLANATLCGEIDWKVQVECVLQKGEKQ